MEHFDIIIIGTGAGGGTLAYALRHSGAKILLLERGDYLPAEPENWSVTAVFFEKRYKAQEEWIDASTGQGFRPGVHYYVGGNTKVFGAAFPRLRREDFAALEHEGGTSPAWPITYDDLEPYYVAAEQIYRVHGQSGEDPTEPWRSTPYPFPPVPDEPAIADLRQRLRQQGLHPFFYPIGIDLREGGRCIRCQTCDGFPCQIDAKSDSDVCCVRPALQSLDVSLWPRAYAKRILTDATGKRATAVEVEKDGQTLTVHADRIVVACGAVNSAALLLRSANAMHPNGLANSSGLLGRNYMQHINSAIMAVNPLRRNRTVFQKTLAINDFYLSGPNWPYPLGNFQLIGKLQAGMLVAVQPLIPRSILQEVANRGIDGWVMTEDLPDPQNRIVLGANGQVHVHWRPNNMVSHQRFVKEMVQIFKATGFPFVFPQAMGIDTNSHQCGTARFGTDPATSVLDPYCQSHDIPNLTVMDSSFFPSSTAMNPALTIIAQALRVAEHLARSTTL